jgi:hypothetical protein
MKPGALIDRQFKMSFAIHHLLLLGLLWAVFASPEDIYVALNQTLHETPPEVAQMQRELFFSQQGNIVACIKRELGDFNDMFDAVAYRDMIMAEAGVTVEGLKEKYSWRDRKRFDETPEHAAIMEVLAKRKVELEEVAQIVEACQEEMAGGRSAVGAGAMVGALLDHAMEGSIDPALTTNGEQSTDYPTPAPSVGKWKFPVWVGFHQEWEIYFLTCQANNFLGGDAMGCIGVSTGGYGLEYSIVVLVSTWPPYTSKNTQATFFGTDAGLIGSVGFQAGGFTEQLDGGNSTCNGPFLFEFTIGVGCSLPSIEPAVCCSFEWS